MILCAHNLRCAQLESSDDLGWDPSCVCHLLVVEGLTCLVVGWLQAVILARCLHHPSGCLG